MRKQEIVLWLEALHAAMYESAYSRILVGAEEQEFYNEWASCLMERI